MSRALSPETSLTRWYSTHVRRYGYDHRALGFGRRSSQEKRFAALLRLGPLHRRSLLDMGCGFGDLLPWLAERGVSPVYTGVDVCAPMIERCRRRFSDAGQFFVGDALTFDAPPGAFDYVVASGIFGLAARGMRARIKPTIERLFRLSRLGLAINFLSTRAPRKSPARIYAEPSQMLDYALTLTPAALLDHSYLPNDFTLVLHREVPWQQGQAA
jgi:ubiquinone/menaquinone biosynthesis C-methylase UbiE